MPLHGPQEGAGDRRDGRARYAIERQLGRGGMATVYLARDTRLERQVALKVLAGELADEAAAHARFLREARLAARLVHPGVVRIYDVGEDERGPYIVMEYVDGTTLAAELQRHGRLPAAVVADLGAQVCAALQAAHLAGLVHRDVKPQNILLDADGRAKLADFGIARAADATVLTEHGALLGTLAYLAPEQARGERVTAAADLYSLGVVLYEALCGRRPHEGASVGELLARRERERPTLPSAHVGDVPPALEAAVMRCLALRPADRPRSASALGRELADAAAGEATLPLVAQTVAAAVAGDRRRARGPLIAVAAALLAALGLVLALRAGGRQATPGTTAAVRSIAPPAGAVPSPPRATTVTQRVSALPAPATPDACAGLAARQADLRRRQQAIQKAFKHRKEERKRRRAALADESKVLHQQLVACGGAGQDAQ